MGQVRIQVNSRSYPITCEDGEEDHLRQLGGYLDAVVKGLGEKLGSGIGKISDTHLLVMASLTIADELSDTYKKIEADTAQGLPIPQDADEAAFAKAIDGMAERLESVAERLEKI